VQVAVAVVATLWLVELAVLVVVVLVDPLLVHLELPTQAVAAVAVLMMEPSDQVVQVALA
jgi:hypothetical protein